jgi:hypothetical protein
MWGPPASFYFLFYTKGGCLTQKLLSEFGMQAAVFAEAYYKSLETSLRRANDGKKKKHEPKNAVDGR